MQIQLVNKPHHFNIEGGPLVRLEGRSGVGVQVGDKILGFSSQDVSSVGLKVQNGNLLVRLLGVSGEQVGTYRIPGAAVLQQHMSALKQMGIHLEVGERDALVKLLKLSMSGAMSADEVILLLDELSHLAPTNAKPAVLDAGNLHPGLESKIRQLLAAMPSAIQRFVLLQNNHRIPKKDWLASLFLSKVDPELDRALVHFLKSDGQKVSPQLKAQINEVAQRTSLKQTTGPPVVTKEAFSRLVDMLENVDVKGNSRIFSPPQSVAKFLFENYTLDIPDFTAADSFDALESDLLAKLRSDGPPAKATKDPLIRALLGRMDARTYREAVSFLAGAPKTTMTTEVRESLRHFIANIPEQPPTERPSVLNPRALERAKSFLQTEFPDLPYRLAQLPEPPVQGRLPGPKLAAAFAQLDQPQKLALFVADHIDPQRDPELFQFLTGKARYPHLPPRVSDALERFLQQTVFPRPQGPLPSIVGPHLKLLTQALAAKPKLEAPFAFLPQRTAVIEQLKQWVPNQSAQAPADDTAPVQHQPEVRGKAMDKLLRGIPEAEQNKLLTRFLGQELKNFRRVAALDQAWQAKELVDRMIKDAGPRNHLRPLQRALQGLQEILSQKEAPDLKWALRNTPTPTDDVDPNPPLKQRLIKSDTGTARYYRLDQMLLDDLGALENRVRDLSWARRIDHFMTRMDKHAADDSARLMRAVARFQPVLQELIDLLGKDGKKDWSLFVDSPLLKRKAKQFMAFREMLAAGKTGDPAPLFEAPFLRSEMSPDQERAYQNEMKRFEPVLREALKRLEDGGDSLFRAVLQHAAPKGVEGMDRIRGLLEAVHEFNQHQNVNQEPLYLSLPLKWAGREGAMELACFRLPKKKKSQGRYLVVLHLDFPNYGHLRVDALREEDRLSATFWVENRKMQDKIMDELHHLEDRLEEQGLGEVLINVKRHPQRATQSVAELCMPPHEGEVDMQI